MKERHHRERSGTATATKLEFARNTAEAHVTAARRLRANSLHAVGSAANRQPIRRHHEKSTCGTNVNGALDMTELACA